MTPEPILTENECGVCGKPIAECGCIGKAIRGHFSESNPEPTFPDGRPIGEWVVICVKCELCGRNPDHLKCPVCGGDRIPTADFILQKLAGKATDLSNPAPTMDEEPCPECGRMLPSWEPCQRCHADQWNAYVNQWNKANGPRSELPKTSGEYLLGMPFCDVWAKDFRKAAIRLGYSDMDEGWLQGWFANAMAAEERWLSHKTTQAQSEARQTIDRLTKERDELAGWKESALTVESWRQRIDAFVRAHKDATLGRGVADIALQFIMERDAALAQVEALKEDGAMLDWLERTNVSVLEWSNGEPSGITSATLERGILIGRVTIDHESHSVTENNKPMPTLRDVIRAAMPKP